MSKFYFLIFIYTTDMKQQQICPSLSSMHMCSNMWQSCRRE